MGSSMASMKSVKLKVLSLRRSLEALVRPLVVDDLKTDENLKYVGGNSPNEYCYNKGHNQIYLYMEKFAECGESFKTVRVVIWVQ